MQTPKSAEPAWSRGMISENTACSTRVEPGWKRAKRSAAVVCRPGQRVSWLVSRGVDSGVAARRRGPTPKPRAEPLGRTTIRSVAPSAAWKLTLPTSKSSDPSPRSRSLSCSMSRRSISNSSPCQSTAFVSRPWKANVSLGQVEMPRRIGRFIAHPLGVGGRDRRRLRGAPRSASAFCRDRRRCSRCRG